MVEGRALLLVYIKHGPNLSLQLFPKYSAILGSVCSNVDHVWFLLVY